MASKKYLSLDEVAGRLSLSPEQVNKFREEGRLRGFADRGTWKFKSDDVDEFARTRQADSAPDVPILDDDFDNQSIVAPSGIQKVGSRTSIVSGEDDDAVGEQPTVIRQDASGSAILDDEPLLASSDSDVRLVLPEGFSAIDSTPEVSVQGDSDSDVQLIDQSSGKQSGGPRSDSDVSLVSDEIDTVSDVRLLSGDDVPVGKSGSDSDVSLVSRKPGSSVFDDDEEEVRPLAAADSGIALESIADSGIALEDSVIGRRSTPGIESSIISLSEDSGIALAGDSAKGSGIDVGSPSDSGIALEALNEGNATQPMMRTAGRRPAGSDDTQFELGSAVDDSEFELATGSGSSIDNDTSVILFEDDDEFSDTSRSGSSQSLSGQSLAGASDEVVELDEEFDAFEASSSGVDMSEDDDLEFEAADEDFDEGFQTGESQADFAPAAQRVAVAPEAEISGLTFTGLAATSALMVVCGMLMFDLVRSMWGHNDPMLSSWLLSSTKDLF